MFQFREYERNSYKVRLPINDAVLVQKHQRQCDFGCIELGSWFIEFSAVLNLPHQVTTVNILHHEKQAILCDE